MKTTNISRIISVALKIFIFLFCFLIVKSIFGLFYWRMANLSPEDLAWVKTISQKTSNDRFVSSTAPPLKLSIRGIDIHNNRNPFYISMSKSDIYEANAGYEYTLTGNGKEFRGWLRIQRAIDRDSLLFGVSFINFRTVGRSREYAQIPLKTQTLTIQGIEFQECISSDTLHWKNKIYSKTDTIQVDSMIVSKKYGLIYFRFSDGTEYYRDFQQ